MPLMECIREGKKGYKWGESGFCYLGANAKEKALQQGRAIEARKSEDIQDLWKKGNKRKLKDRSKNEE